MYNLSCVTNGIRRVYLQYLCTKQCEGSVGTLLQKQFGISSSFTVGDELVCVFETTLLYSLKFWSLGNWGWGMTLVLPKDWHLSANCGKFRRKLY